MVKWIRVSAPRDTKGWYKDCRPKFLTAIIDAIVKLDGLRPYGALVTYTDCFSSRHTTTDKNGYFKIEIDYPDVMAKHDWKGILAVSFFLNGEYYHYNKEIHIKEGFPVIDKDDIIEFEW